jgi:hypothetical protein
MHQFAASRFVNPSNLGIADLRFAGPILEDLNLTQFCMPLTLSCPLKADYDQSNFNDLKIRGISIHILMTCVRYNDALQ